MPSQTNPYQSSKPQRDGKFPFERLGNFFLWARSRLAIFWVVCWIMGGILFAIFDFDTLQEAFLSRNWQKTTGKIIPNKKGLLRTKNSVRIRYTFRVDGRTHQGTRIRILGEYSGIHSKKLDNAVLKQSVQKKTCLVFYDPEDPNRCALQSGIRWHHLLAFGIGCVFVLIGILPYWLIKHSDQQDSLKSMSLEEFLKQPTPRQSIPYRFVIAKATLWKGSFAGASGAFVMAVILPFFIGMFLPLKFFLLTLLGYTPVILLFSIITYLRRCRINILKNGVVVDAKLSKVHPHSTPFWTSNGEGEFAKREYVMCKYNFTFTFLDKPYNATQKIQFEKYKDTYFQNIRSGKSVQLLVDPVHPDRVIWIDATFSAY